MADNLLAGNTITKSLAASFTAGPFSVASRSLALVKLKFSSTGTFDAVGTVGVKEGEEGWESDIAFEDENGDTQTTKAVTDALDDTAMRMVIPDCAETQLWVDYVSTSDGDNDSVEIQVKSKRQ